MSPKIRRCIAIVCACCLAPATLWAYEYTYCGVKPCYWERYPVKYYINDNVENLFNGARDVIIGSFERWGKDRQSFCELDFQNGGSTDVAATNYPPDYKNVVFRKSSGWEHGDDTLALTQCYYEISGNIVDCDIVINAQDYQWSSDGAGGTYNLADTITHEIGHFWGLDHTDVEEATMYPYYNEKSISSDLDEDDIRAAADAFCDGDMPPDDGCEQDDSLWLAQSDFEQAELFDLRLYDKDVFRIRNKGGTFPLIEIADEDDERYKLVGLYSGTAGKPDFHGQSWCLGNCLVAPARRAVDSIVSYIMVETNFECSSISASPYHITITQVESVDEDKLSEEPDECADSGDDDDDEEDDLACGCGL